jgi:hypothetical protein
MELKKCNKCNKFRDIIEFSKDCDKKDGLRTICKICGKKKYLENRDKEIERVKTYQNNNREIVLKQKLISAKKYFIKNREKIKKYQKNYMSNRRKTDILFKLSDRLRSRLYGFLKKNCINKSNETFGLVGCTPQELKIHLEEKFAQGMSWDNQGKWHIDHKIPLSSAKTEEELYNLCHFTNLQPMWAIDNIKKGSKII